jgi:glycosyltransferase involved in cell wall biosynthesis
MLLDVVGAPLNPAYLAHLKAVAGEGVRFHHDWDDATVAASYRRALCVVLPSVYHARGYHTTAPELLGQTALEGMASGRPVIATDVGALPEVVVHRQTGLLVAPNAIGDLASAIELLRDHPDYANTLGQQARERVQERFTWTSVVSRCLVHYAASH